MMPAVNRDIAETIDSLRAPIGDDPYWPKWDGPWWRAMTLWELGHAEAIPSTFIDDLVARVDSHCLHFFPVRPEELPPGADPRRNVACHCQLGTLYQLLHAARVDVDAALPWIRPWFLKYQLPDGGLNCDESVYAGDDPRSSFVSTLPPLEAVLFCTDRPFTREEIRFLDRGAQYLLERKLCRSLRKHRIADRAWLRPTFPRFYHYDVLRGYEFVVEWAATLGRAVMTESLEIARRVRPTVQRRAWAAETKTLSPEDWSRQHRAKSFPLLERVSRIGEPLPD